MATQEKKNQETKSGIKGLTTKEADENLIKFGPNQIFKPAKITFWGIAKDEIREPMILLLLVVGILYSIWGKLQDVITIFVIIFLLVLAEVFNEFRAKRAIAALEQIAAPKTKVMRDGEIKEVDSDEIVPGDILVINSGIKIAADAILKRAINIEIDESAFTGEPFPQKKEDGAKIYAGTVLISGEGLAEVFETGKNTRLGKIGTALKEIKPPKTALQLAMKSLAGKLVYLALFFSILIPLIGFLRGQDFKTMILTGLSLSFATIPEELPIIVTMVLGLGAYNLSKHNFLIKKISSAEVLGSATCIVTDKTGTLTIGKMKVSNIYSQNNSQANSGDKYQDKLDINDEVKKDKKNNKEKEVLKNALGATSAYSLSSLERAIKEEAKEISLGEVSEEFLGEILSQRDIGDGRKTKAVIRKIGYEEQRLVLFVTGAPEEVFAKCKNVSNEAKKELEKETSNGKRVIAVAVKTLNPSDKNLDFEKIEREMEFSGLISFEDPPRDGVKETIETAKNAGIRTIMVTGDHPKTAIFVAQKVGIKDGGQVLTGKDLDKISDEELKEAVKNVSIFARTEPQHKYRIVKALQENGEVVAVTGDGINDVLALKAANIGISMGQKGTDVAEEAAGIVLADDNFITITNGIFEGRKFYDNLTKGVNYYLSVKVALILIFLLPVILGVPLPFTPIQIIILELFMDLAASAGFVAEPKEKEIYLRPPRNSKETLFGKKTIQDILIKGGALFAVVSAVYLYTLLYQKASLPEAQTLAFSTWIFGHIILAFISRSDKEPLFSLGFFANRIINLWALAAVSFLLIVIYVPGLGGLLNTVPVKFINLIIVFLIVIVVIGILEIRKLIYSKTKLKELF